MEIPVPPVIQPIPMYAAAVSTRRGLPPIPFITRNVCPGELCRYGTWAATKPLKVYTQEETRSKIAFTLAPGERFTSVTGNIWTWKPGIAKILKSNTYGETRYEKGETLYVLCSEGEGDWTCWYKGKTLSWYLYGPRSMNPNKPDSDAELISFPQSTWWIKVVNHKKQTGWLPFPEDSSGIDLLDTTSG